MVQTLLFVTGIKTLLQTLFGTRLPTIMGGSYAYVVPILSIVRDPSFARIADGHTVSMQASSSTVFFIISETKQNWSWKTEQVDVMNPSAYIFFASVLLSEIPADYEGRTRFTDCILKHPNNPWI